MSMREWVKLPTEWIRLGGLKRFRWEADRGSDNVAALIALIAIAHHADDENGVAKLTYNDLQGCTNLSRAKLSAGLTVLEENNIVVREPCGRSTYRLVDYGLVRWGKLPARRLYASGNIIGFSEFHLRKVVELHALKVFLLVIERRDNGTNLANISYEKIQDYSGIARHQIKSAISLLAANGLLHVEHVPSDASQYGISNAYRLPFIDPYSHMGTKGRGLDKADLSF